MLLENRYRRGNWKTREREQSHSVIDFERCLRFDQDEESLELDHSFEDRFDTLIVVAEEEHRER